MTTDQQQLGKKQWGPPCLGQEGKPKLPESEGISKGCQPVQAKGLRRMQRLGAAEQGVS